MTESEERPSKIRKLDLSVGHHADPDSRPNVEVAGFKRNSEDQPNLDHGDLGEQPQSVDRDDSGNNEIQCSGQTQPISKNQLKKLKKQQEWELGRGYRKAKRKEKEKAKKARKAEERAAAREPQNPGKSLPDPNPPQESHRRRPIQVPITLLVDCDFDELMTENELKSLGSQVTRCYSDVKSAPYRAHLVISSFSGKLKQRFETVLASNHLAWRGVEFTQEDFVSAAHEADKFMRSSQGGKLVGALAGEKDSAPIPVHITPSNEANSEVATQSAGLQSATKDDFTVSDKGSIPALLHEPTGSHPVSEEHTSAGLLPPKQKSQDPPSLVYLTSDSPHVLEALSPYTTYIIGGIVDKNRHKGICYKRAAERNIPTAKLPIGEYMTMQSRTVLATNHVVEIMVKWLESGDWAKAFISVIPKRKEAKLKVIAEGDPVEAKIGDTSSNIPQSEPAFVVESSDEF